MRADRPNFILFITDQHRADYLGCYGHPVLRTPNIDKLAECGVAFDRFYVASPVCMPNRSSLMTGRMPSVHGARSNGIPLSRAAVTFVDQLRATGYRTALIGKSHLQNFSGADPVLPRPEPTPGYDQPPADMAEAVRHDLSGAEYDMEDPGFWEQPDAHVATPFYGFDHVELVTRHGDNVGGDYRRWLFGRAPDAGRLIGRENQLPHDYACPQAVRTAVPPELYSTHYIAERAAAWLAANAGDEAPFFLMVSFPDPHHPFNPPGKYWDMYDPDDMEVPRAFTRNDWSPPPHVQGVLDRRAAGEARLDGTDSIGINAREAQEARALSCGMITCIDDAIGDVVAGLDAAGRADETVTMFTTDHGDHLGDHRLLLKGAEQYRSLLRVPFIWSDPADPRNARRHPGIASTIDIPMTILDRAGIDPAWGVQGRSLLPVVEDETAAVRDAALVQFEHQRPYPGIGHPPRIHTIVDARWRMSVVDGVDWGELYDLEADPGEFVNLWDDPSRSAVRAELMERLARAEIAHVDRVPFPTGRA